MAAHMASQIRVLCYKVDVLTLLRRNCDTGFSKGYAQRSLASISGSIFVKSRSTNKYATPACSSLTTARGFQTDPDVQDDNKQQEEQQNPDHPIPNIEDPFKEPVEPCILCKHKVPVSYKNVQMLSQFVSPNTGRIYGRYITKLCSYQQRCITKAIKRSRIMGFMPYMYRETIFLKDPNLFDIKYTGSVEIAMKEPSNLVEPETVATDDEPQENPPDK